MSLKYYVVVYFAHPSYTVVSSFLLQQEWNKCFKTPCRPFHLPFISTTIPVPLNRPTVSLSLELSYNKKGQTVIFLPAKSTSIVTWRFSLSSGHNIWETPEIFKLTLITHHGFVLLLLTWTGDTLPSGFQPIWPCQCENPLTYAWLCTQQCHPLFAVQAQLKEWVGHRQLPPLLLLRLRCFISMFTDSVGHWFHQQG